MLARRAGARAHRPRLAGGRGVRPRRAARRGSRGRGRRGADAVLGTREYASSARELAAEASRGTRGSVAIGGRSRTSTATRSGSTSVEARELGARRDVDEPGAPQRGRRGSRSPAGRARRAGGCGARARRGRPARSRRGRSARRCRRAARARRPSPRRTAPPRAASRRPAYSPPSGCTKPASCGNSDESSGRATSSVTRPPPVGSPWSGRR